MFMFTVYARDFFASMPLTPQYQPGALPPELGAYRVLRAPDGA